MCARENGGNMARLTRSFKITIRKGGYANEKQNESRTTRKRRSEGNKKFN